MMFGALCGSIAYLLMVTQRGYLSISFKGLPRTRSMIKWFSIHFALRGHFVELQSTVIMTAFVFWTEGRSKLLDSPPLPCPLPRKANLCCTQNRDLGSSLIWLREDGPIQSRIACRSRCRHCFPVYTFNKDLERLIRIASRCTWNLMWYQIVFE